MSPNFRVQLLFIGGGRRGVLGFKLRLHVLYHLSHTSGPLLIFLMLSVKVEEF
jgi:hypothetical protein